MKICVLGLGYIGLPTACMFALNGVHVRGVDINPSVVNQLRTGNIHINEPGLDDVIKRVIQEKMMTFESVPDRADVFIIAVPTPITENKQADLSFVVNAAETRLPFLEKGNLIVLESTSPPKTTDDLLVYILEKSGFKAGKDFLLCYSPERVLPGQILKELVENPRVIGGITPESSEAGKSLYQTFVKGEIFLTDSTSAEMIKLMENTYRDVNIALANEFSKLADRFGVDIINAIKIANNHPRVNVLQPGPGVGGHCISVDPWFFVDKAPDISRLIRTARETNDSQPNFVIEIIKRLLGRLEGKKIGILGLTYKPDVDDARESPSIKIVKLLQEEGVNTISFDPHTVRIAEDITCVDSIGEVFKEVDLVVMLVGHAQFKNIQPEILLQSNSRLVLDTVNAVPVAWKNFGYNIFHLGNGEDFAHYTES